MDESPNKRAKGDEGNGFRFLITNAIAGVVIGKGGETVKQIREQCDVVVNIMKADGFEERVMVVKGEPHNVAKAMSMVVQGIVANNEKTSQGVNSTDARVLVHSMHCGAIIGKGGSTIKETMANSGASLKISNEPLPGSTEKVCDIAGSPSQITSALTAVLTQLHNNPLNAGVQKVNYMSGGPAGAPAHAPMGAMAANPYGEPHHQQAFDAYGAPVAAAYGAPQGYGGAYAQAAAPHTAHGHGEIFDTSGPPTACELAVPTGACGAIIGKGGGTVKYINASSGCTVNLSDRGEGDTRKVTIKGPKNGINVAIFLIRQAIEQQSAQTGGAGMGNTEPVSKTMMIESAKAGLLIGKGGSTIQEIKKFSGCSVVNINTATEEDPAHRMVTIKGTPLAVQCALTIIGQKLEDTPAGGGGGSATTLSHLPQFNGGFSGQPEGESITVQVAIPTSMAGAVIGKGGSVVKDLKAATGCNVNIAPPTADAPEERVVTITGTRTDYAVSLIQGLVTPQ